MHNDPLLPMPRLRKLCALLFVLLAVSCKDAGISPLNENIGNVFVETEYTNWAWGFQYQGKIILQNGSVYTYNPGKDTMAVLHHDDELYTEAELQSKYAHRQIFVRVVHSDTISLIRRLAAEVTANEFSDTTGVGADMGSFVYSVYVYRPESTRFERRILKLEGDWTFYNKSKAAIALVGLMKQL